MTQRCRVCGCSNLSSCAGGCWWVDDDLCSSCAVAVDVATGKPLAIEEVGLVTDTNLISPDPDERP